MIQLRILGSADLRGDDGQVVLSLLSQPKRLTLLSYLALTSTGTFAPREKLIGLFWPESDPERGRGSLRTALSGLRKSLGPHVLTTRGDDEVGIAANVIWCDAAEFAAALDRGDLESAWDLYAGPLLESVSMSEAPALDRWLEDERTRLARKAVQAAIGLSERSEAAGDSGDASRWAREALSLEPLSEIGIRRLMRLLALVGDREGAVLEFETFTARLSEELDLDPSDETVALVESIRSGSISGSPIRSGEFSAAVEDDGTAETAVVSEPAGATVSVGDLSPLPDSPAVRTARPVDRTARWSRLAIATVVLAAFIVGAALWGSRPAQGVIGAGEQVVLADFADATGEGIGDAVTEALRIDLLESSVLDLVEAVDIAPTLELMRLEPGAALTAERAREVALRDGIAAIIDGDVASVGSGYLITATLRATESGRSLAALRVAADGPDAVIGSIDRLSEGLRERSGESLRAIRAGKPLEQVTTSSLEALKLYSQATRALYERSDNQRGRELLERALVLDSTFAMAWRLLGVARYTDPLGRAEATTNAFRFRHRLQDAERYVVEAIYYTGVEPDFPRAIEAYESTLEMDSLDPRALNNLSQVVQRGRNDLEGAEDLLRRAVGSPGRAVVQYSNLFATLIHQGKVDEATALLQDWEEAFPNSDGLRRSRHTVLFFQGDLAGAAELAHELSADMSRGASDRSASIEVLARLAYWSGRMDEARSWFLEAEALAALAGPRIDWETHRDAAYEEALVGERDWARIHLREALRDGAYGLLPFAETFHADAALHFASAGDSEAAELIVRDWEGGKPEQTRGASEIALIGLASLHTRVSRGDTARAVDSQHRLLREMGCSEACYPFLQATLHDRLGDNRRAAELYERVLRPGYAGWGLNTGERLRAMMRLGPLYDELGDTAKAVAAYQRMVDQWANGDARALETVERFRARIVQAAEGIGNSKVGWPCVGAARLGVGQSI